MRKWLERIDDFTGFYFEWGNALATGITRFRDDSSLLILATVVFGGWHFGGPCG